MHPRALGLAVTGLLATGPVVAGQAVISETVPGIVNFSAVDATVACAGATTPAALAEVKSRGYRSVLNLRMASENGADIDAARTAAKALGLTYLHLPMNSASPAPDLVDRFLAAVTDRNHQPVYIHCASANRAGGVWMVTRLGVAGGPAAGAGTEAAALGLTNPALRTFALEQAAARK